MGKFAKIATIAAIVGASVVLAASAFAAKPSGNTRPGWGFGDKNHVHTGPPGKSVSVHPGHHGDGDNDADDQGENDNGKHHKFHIAWGKAFHKIFASIHFGSHNA